jgi:hypothetical protein
VIRTETGLFYALEKVLMAAKGPLTASQAYDIAEIREHASSVNRVSDYLGGLWRKGRALRVPAPKEDNSSARWAYLWNMEHADNHAGATAVVTAAIPARSSTSRSILNKPAIDITEDGDLITIDLPGLVITIRPKK